MEELLAERQAWEAEVGELDDFRHSTAFLLLDREEQVLLNRQSVCMHGLVEVLTERVARLKLRKPGA
jgi:hypothetical protein